MAARLWRPGIGYQAAENSQTLAINVKGTSGNLLWKWGAEKIPAGEAINAKLSGDSGRFSNEDSGDFIKLQPA
ncbi:MAG: hypothetical protein ACI9UA_001257 [Pseudoalteromonas tetraodonis]|jgi:hypothetical protein